MRRIMSCLLAGAMCLSLAACGAGEDTAAALPPERTAAPAATPAPAKTGGYGPSDAPDKEETVYVKALPDGSAYEVTVQTVLNYGGDGSVIEDVTELTDIKNTEGDEDFTLGKDGALTWEDHGERIRYEGKSDRGLPVSVRISYWLDGEKIEPADLAGRSGHVRIRFDYENAASETVQVTHADLSDGDDGEPEPPETERVETPVPFLALTLVMLPEDVFSNVTAENGRVVSFGDESAVLGYALPGLQDALSLEAFEPTEDMELPSYVEIEADAVDFKLDFTATVVTNGLFDELETEDLDDIEKLSDGLDKLMEAADELADGAGELAGGAEDFAAAIGQYASGAGQVQSGAAAVSEGLAALSAQTGALRQAASAVTGSVDGLRDELSGAGVDAMTDTAAALERLITDIDGFETGLAAMSGYTAAMTEAAAGARAALTGADFDISATLDGLELTAEQRAAIDASLAGPRAAVDTARSALAALPAAQADPQLAGYIEALSSGAASLRERAAAALVNLDELPSSPAAALDEAAETAAGVTLLCDAIDALAEGSAALADGTAALSQGGSALTGAARTLADGADSLTEALEKFRDEGVAELTDKAGDGLLTLVTQLRALRQADADFDNFGGAAEGRTGSVRFIIETDSIGK